MGPGNYRLTNFRHIPVTLAVTAQASAERKQKKTPKNLFIFLRA